MNNELQIFENEQFGRVRTVIKTGAPWFVASDVCNALDLSNTAMALARLEDDEKGVSSIDTLGGVQEVAIVNEPGLYSLVLGSRKPEAKAFKRWVTHDVIPAIHKTGMYATDKLLEDPDLAIAAFTALKEERAKRKQLETQVAADAPKVLFASAVEASHTSILIGDLAKLLRQNGVEVGRDRLFDWMRANGYLIKYGTSRNMPTQYSMERGLMEIREGAVHHPSGNAIVTQTTVVTGKGQTYFINLFLKNNLQKRA